MTKNLIKKLVENGDHRGAHGQAYKDKSKPTDIRSSNINAAKGKSNTRFTTTMSFFPACQENITLYSNVSPQVCIDTLHIINRV